MQCTRLHSRGFGVCSCFFRIALKLIFEPVQPMQLGPFQERGVFTAAKNGRIAASASQPQRPSRHVASANLNDAVLLRFAFAFSLSAKQYTASFAAARADPGHVPEEAARSLGRICGLHDGDDCDAPRAG
eukprot:3793208-Pleurochrysis_carterae.AAC.2